MRVLLIDGHEIAAQRATALLHQAEICVDVADCAEEAGLELVREFVYLERWAVRGAPEKQEGRGFLFRRRTP